MTDDRDSLLQRAFARQAGAFARSPLQNSPERLRRLLAFAGARAGERALDLACGPGIVTAALAGEGLRAVGIDLTLAMLREAVSGARGGLYLQGDATRLPFRQATFDLVVCRNVLHHSMAPDRITAEAARVLRSGGRLVIEDMRAPDDAQRREYHETIEHLRDEVHARTLTRDEMRASVGRAGLRPADEQPVTLVIDFVEWIDRAFPEPAARSRVEVMMRACLVQDLAGLRVWEEDGRLMFERSSLLLRADRP